MTRVALVNGAKYYAGADRPFFISRGAVNGWLGSRGFTQIAWHDRSEATPSTVVPRKDPSYVDSWDEWVEANYTGLPTAIDTPVALPWLIVLLPSAVADPSIVSTSQKPSWVSASQQAAQAAQAAGMASLASANGQNGLGSAMAVPATLQPIDASSVPRASDGIGRAGAAALAGGFALVLVGIAAKLLRRRH